MHIDELDTPVVTIDLDQLEHNIEKLQKYLTEHQIANRPHIKTHKIPAIAHMQIEAGAVGITCQKLGEAEVMIHAGIKDILITYNIIGDRKLERLMNLAKQATVSVTADSQVTIDGLAKAAQAANTTLTVLVECDTGMERCGVQSLSEAVDLGRSIARSDSLQFGGLMTYPSCTEANDFMREVKTQLSADGIAVDWVSGGGTPVMWHAHEFPEITEHRAGMYVYGDRYTLKSGAMQVDDCAMKIITTVVSRPTAERGILDGGSKTFSSDLLGLDGYGMILEYPDARIIGQSEEHGHVDFSACVDKPQIGERVTVIPNHCCVVSNLHDAVVGVRGDQVVTRWEVAARGKLQ